MWWCRKMPPSDPPPANRATRFARPGADSTISLAIPSAARISARNRAPAISLPGGLVVSIVKYRRNSSTVSVPSVSQAIAPTLPRLPKSLDASGDSSNPTEPCVPGLQPAARLPHVDVGAGRDPGAGGAEGEERDPMVAQVVHHGAALHAVGGPRDGYGVARGWAE